METALLLFAAFQGIPDEKSKCQLCVLALGAWLHHSLQPTAERAPRCHGVDSERWRPRRLARRVQLSSSLSPASIFLTLVELYGYDD